MQMIRNRVLLPQKHMPRAMPSFPGLKPGQGPDGNLEMGVDLVGEHTNEVFIRNINCVSVSIIFPDFVMYPGSFRFSDLHTASTVSSSSSTSTSNDSREAQTTPPNPLAAIGADYGYQAMPC